MSRICHCHTVCPFCGHECDYSAAVTNKRALLEEPRMKPGDISMCIQCGEFGLMAEDEMLRKPTAAEQLELERNVIVRLTRQAWGEMQRARS